jgi:uncharacterized protein YukE
VTADPTAGDPDAIRRTARLFERHAEAVRAGARLVVDAAETASSGWAGKAQEQFLTVAATLPSSARRIASRLDAAAATVHAYAREVEQIQDEADRLQRAQQSAVDDAAANARAIRETSAIVQSAEAVESDTVQLRRLRDASAEIAASQDRLDAQWEELVTRRAAADHRAATALEEPEVVGELRSPRAITTMSDERFLAWLGALDDETVPAAVDDPNVGIRLAGMGAAAVAAWWKDLRRASKDALIAALPRVIGNLDGVAYADRGAANWRTVDRVSRAIERRTADLVGILHRGGSLTTAQRAELETLADRQRAIEAIRTTMSDSTAGRPYTVVSLMLGRPPLAAVAVGDMDTATRVTTAVPGMGATVAGGLRSWAGGATNLHAAQQLAARRLGVDPDVATVAWVGYDTPKLPPALEVMSSAKARAGAERLETFLAGVSATRGWQPGDHLSLVGHSYGTTTATLATAKTPVDNLTLLASAGVDRSVPDVAAVQVPSGHTWASQAKDDLVANIGRGVVEAHGPAQGGPQPELRWGNRSWVTTVPSEHPLNPGGTGWGARTFSSDDQTIDGRHYEGSDGHGATPATRALEDGRVVEQHGYLDRGTSSLWNTAYTSLGYTPDGKLIP